MGVSISYRDKRRRGREKRGVSDEGESSGGTGVTGRPLGCSGSSIIHAWKTALSEGECEIIHLSKPKDGTLYRGVNKGKNPYSLDDREARLGEGVHFTDDLDELLTLPRYGKRLNPPTE